MFDPYHNARAKEDHGQPFVMYMTKGTWAGSWEGLTPDVGVVSWLYNSQPSLQFFAQRGHQQVLAGYYDADPARIVPWLESAAQCEGVVGVTYTTWVNVYSQLNAFIEHVKTFVPGAQR